MCYRVECVLIVSSRGYKESFDCLLNCFVFEKPRIVPKTKPADNVTLIFENRTYVQSFQQVAHQLKFLFLFFFQFKNNFKFKLSILSI